MSVRHIGIAAGVLILAFGTASVPAMAAGYSCRNGEFQIGCNKEKCENSDSFTPMQLSVDPDKKRVEICAYSGCWSGPLTVLGSDTQLIVGRGDQLQGEAPQGTRQASIALILDKGPSSSASATVVAFGMIAPMSCVVE